MRCKTGTSPCRTCTIHLLQRTYVLSLHKVHQNEGNMPNSLYCVQKNTSSHPFISGFSKDSENIWHFLQCTNMSCSWNPFSCIQCRKMDVKFLFFTVCTLLLVVILITHTALKMDVASIYPPLARYLHLYSLRCMNDRQTLFSVSYTFIALSISCSKCAIFSSKFSSVYSSWITQYYLLYLTRSYRLYRHPVLLWNRITAFSTDASSLQSILS